MTDCFIDSYLYCLLLVPLLPVPPWVHCCLSTTCTSAAHCHPCSNGPATKCTTHTSLAGGGCQVCALLINCDTVMCVASVAVMPQSGTGCYSHPSPDKDNEAACLLSVRLIPPMVLEVPHCAAAVTDSCGSCAQLVTQQQQQAVFSCAYHRVANSCCIPCAFSTSTEYKSFCCGSSCCYLRFRGGDLHNSTTVTLTTSYSTSLQCFKSSLLVDQLL